MIRDLWGWLRKVWTFGQIIHRDTGAIPTVTAAACLVDSVDQVEIFISCKE